MTDGFEDKNIADAPKAKAPLGMTPLSRLDQGKPKKLVPMVGGLALLIGIGAAGYMYVSSMGSDVVAPVAEAPPVEQVASQDGLPPLPETAEAGMPVVDPSLEATVDPLTGVPVATEVPMTEGVPTDVPVADMPVADVTADANAAGQQAPLDVPADQTLAPPAGEVVNMPVDTAATVPTEPTEQVNAPELPAPDGLPAPQDNMIDETALGATPEVDGAIPLEPMNDINAPSLPPMPDVGAPSTTEPAAEKTALTPPAMEDEALIVEGQDPLADTAATPPGPSTGQTAQGASDAQAEAALQELANQAEAAYIRPLPKGFLVLDTEQRASSSEAVMASASRKLSSGDYKGALAIYDELYATSPNDVRIMMGRAIALQKIGRSDEAVLAYEQVLNFQPSNLDALTNMIGLLSEQNPALASTKLEALRKTYPANGKIAAQYAITQSKLGNFQVALGAFDQAIKMGGADAYYHYGRAVVLDKMGRRNEAANGYRTALELQRAGKTSQTIPVEAVQNRLAAL